MSAHLAAQYRQVLQEADVDLVAVALIGDALRPRTADMQVCCRTPKNATRVSFLGCVERALWGGDERRERNDDPR